MERRWQIQTACNLTLSGAGTPLVGGLYCEVEPFDGHRMWVKYGTTGFANAIFWAAVKWVVQRNGSVVYQTTDEGVSVDGPYPINWTTAVLGDDPAPSTSITDGWETVDAEGVVKWSEEPDQSIGCIAMRLKLGSDLTFSGDEYDRFLALLRNPARRCEAIRIRRQWKCLGGWNLLWNGVFSVVNGEWDHDACLMSVRPEPDDEYTCILRAMNREVNVLTAGIVDVNVAITPSIEFAGYKMFVMPGGGAVYCSRAYGGVTFSDGPPYDDGFVVQNGTPDNGWAIADDGSIPGVPYFVLYWRERVTTICVGGAPQPPPGAGWTLLTNNCEGDGTATYVRPPVIPYTYGLPTEGTCAGGDETPPDDTCNWIMVMDCNEDPACLPASVGPLYICFNPTPIEYTRGRLLQEIANLLLEESGCEQTEIVSDFLEWNAPGDADGYAPGMNYVTGLQNTMAHLVALDKSDAAYPTASSPATIGKMSLGQLFAMFAAGPRLFWRIIDGKVRVEHWSYWTTPIGMSTLAFPASYKSEPLAHVSLKAEIPRLERGRAAESRGMDFKGADVRYSGPCVASSEDGSDVKEWSVGSFTFDIELVLTDPSTIDTSSGWVVLATAFDGAAYNTISEAGALSGNVVPNAPMSWANLQRDFWQHDRFLPSGTMNEQPTTFAAYLPTIEQKNVVIRHCCGPTPGDDRYPNAWRCCLFIRFDSSKRVATALGNLLGTNGVPITALVRRAEYDEAEDTLTLTLRYAY